MFVDVNSLFYMINIIYFSKGKTLNPVGLSRFMLNVNSLPPVCVTTLTVPSEVVQ